MAAVTSPDQSAAPMSLRPRLPTLGGLARGTIAVLAWNIARLLTQLAWVVLMARSLSVEGYGSFSGIAGLAIALSGLVGAGLGLRMYQDVARKHELFGLRWAQAKGVMAWSALLLWVLFVGVGSLAFADVSLAIIAAVAIAELVGSPMVTHVAFAYAAHGRLSAAAAAPVFMSLARLLAVILFPLLSAGDELQTYALLHASTTLGCAMVQWAWCGHSLAPTPTSGKLDADALSEGARLSSIWASGQALGALDKTMALREGGAEIAGQYTAASRFASLAALPVDALVTAAMPRLFRAGTSEGAHPQLVLWLLGATFGYGIVVGGALMAGATLLPLLLGVEFAPAVPVMSVLALYVPAYCLRTLGANILLGSGRTRWRLASELAALLLLAALMAAWAPEGAVGAAWAVVITEAALMTSLWGRIAIGGWHRKGESGGDGLPSRDPGP